MDIKTAIEKRRAIKQFDPDFQISSDDLKEILSIAMMSPSSFNIQHWRFVDVQDKEKRQAIRAAAWDQSQVTDASHIFLLCGDVKAWKKDPAGYWEESLDKVQEKMTGMIGDFYDGREWIQRDEVLRSVGIIAQSFMLAAIERGYDTCPMIGFDQEKVAEIINLPNDHIIGMMLALGKRAQEPFPRGGYLDFNKIYIQDSF
jgi:nitroreductase